MYEVTIHSKPGRKLIGLEYHGPMTPSGYGYLWDQFVPRHHEIQHATDFFGAMHGDEASFHYLAGREVAHFDQVPDGMVTWEAPEGNYAVLTIPSLDEIKAGFGYIFGEWMPQHGYRPGGYSLEFYPPKFPEDPRVEIWVRVEKVSV